MKATRSSCALLGALLFLACAVGNQNDGPAVLVSAVHCIAPELYFSRFPLISSRARGEHDEKGVFRRATDVVCQRRT